MAIQRPALIGKSTLEEQFLKMGGQKVPEFPSTFTFPGYGGLALVIYVDDFVLSGKAEWHDQFWQNSFGLIFPSSCRWMMLVI